MTRTERDAIDQLANALQAASPLATELRQTIGSQIDTAVKLEASINRAIRAIRLLIPTKGRA